MGIIRQDISAMQALLHHQNMKPGFPSEFSDNDILDKLGVGESLWQPLIHLGRVKHLLIRTELLDGCCGKTYFIWVNEVPAGQIEAHTNPEGEIDGTYYEFTNDHNLRKLLTLNGINVGHNTRLYTEAAFDPKIYVSDDLLDHQLDIGDYDPSVDFGPEWNVIGAGLEVVAAERTRGPRHDYDDENIDEPMVLRTHDYDTRLGQPTLSSVDQSAYSAYAEFIRTARDLATQSAFKINTAGCYGRHSEEEPSYTLTVTEADLIADIPSRLSRSVSVPHVGTVVNHLNSHWLEETESHLPHEKKSTHCNKNKRVCNRLLRKRRNKAKRG